MCWYITDVKVARAVLPMRLVVVRLVSAYGTPGKPELYHYYSNHAPLITGY